MAWGQYHWTQAYDITLFKINFISPAHLQPVSLCQYQEQSLFSMVERSGALQVKCVFPPHKSQYHSLQSTPKEWTTWIETALLTTSREDIKEDGLKIIEMYYYCTKWNVDVYLRCYNVFIEIPKFIMYWCLETVQYLQKYPSVEVYVISSWWQWFQFSGIFLIVQQSRVMLLLFSTICWHCL